MACYGPKVNGWCRRRGLQAADAEDVTQVVLLRLARALRTFTYDPSRTFRGWLRLVTQHALLPTSSRTGSGRRAAGSGDDRLVVRAVLENAAGRTTISWRCLTEEFTPRDREPGVCRRMCPCRAANVGGVFVDGV